MAKRPLHIAQSLRAFRNAHRLGLLRYVSIVPGANPCEAALFQNNLRYSGYAVPRLPLSGCESPNCQCEYLAVGTEKPRELNADVAPVRPVAK